MKKRRLANLCFMLSLVIIFAMGIIVGTKVFPEKIQEIVYLNDGEQTVTVYIPGVNQQGEGVMTELTAMLKHGSGQVLVNVNDVIACYELQVFARTAVHSVENITGTKMKDYDVSYSIKTDAGVIDGGSAGGAMAVAVLSMVKNVKLSRNAAMTGAVDANGRILPVGLVDKKADAVRMANISAFVVPAGQGSQVEQARKETCQQGDIEFCKIEYAPMIEKTSAGIAIKEVSTVQEALNAMSEEGAKKIIRDYARIKPAEQPMREHLTLPSLGISLEGYSTADVLVDGTNVFLKVNCTSVPALTTQDLATSIANGIYNKVIGKPNTHDTAANIMDSYGIDIIAVTVDSYEAGYFKGRIFTFKGGKLASIDAKPSDGVALGARFGSPVYVSDALLKEKGVNSC